MAALVGIVIELSRHGARTHAGDVGLHDAYHAVNILHAHAGAGDSATRSAIGRGDKGIGAVVDIQQGSLGTLEQQRLALVDHIVEQKTRLADIGTQALGVRQILLANLVDRVGGQVIEKRQLGIDAGERDLELLTEEVLVQHILHAQADTGHLVLIARTDAAPRGTDVVLAQQRLERTVQIHVVRHDDVRVAGDAQVLGRHAVVLEHIDLFENHLGVHDAAVSDNSLLICIHDARGDLMQAVFLVAHHDGVACVVATGVAHNAIKIACDKVDDLAFALVAPLTSDQHGRRHLDSFTNTSAFAHSNVSSLQHKVP